MFVFANHLLLFWGFLCATPPAASTPVAGGSRPYVDWFFLNRDPPCPLPPPRPRPPPACDGGGIPAVAGVGIFGAKFAVWGGVYGFVAPGLRYMFVGTGGGAAHVGGALHAGLPTVGVVSIFAIFCACCPIPVSSPIRQRHPSCQLMGYTVFSFPLRRTLCPALMYASALPRSHPSWWCAFLHPVGKVLLVCQ